MIAREGAKRLASDRQVHSLYDGAAFRNAGKTEPLRGKRDLFASSRESKKSGGEAPRSGTAGGLVEPGARLTLRLGDFIARHFARQVGARSEEHTSELQSLMRISYAVFWLKQKKNKT